MISTLAALAVLGVQSGPIRVEVRKTGDQHQLLRGGKPYFVKGVGGSASLDLLVKSGGNSIRTWGVGDDTQKILDDAHARGLTVALGIWLGHERHGFNYDDPAQVRRQFETAREAVRRYRNHPALLLWGVGNEMEGFAGGDNPKIWRAVNEIAEMIEEEDPNHPTMTVIAEVGGGRIPSIHELAPAIDIVGINSYGGASTVVKRYRESGGKKPVLLTEFGPIGPWEARKTEWGAAMEPTSTEKGEMYRRHYSGAIIGNPNLVLGGYAFLWGHKQENTATWFGMLLPDGNRVASADVISELWTGKAPANRVPVVNNIKLEGPAIVAPGAQIKVTLDVSDPEKDPVKVEWALKREATELGSGGDAEPAQPVFNEAKVSASESSAVFRAPSQEQGYRIYVTIRDGKGGAATANIPILVQSKEALEGVTRASLPFTVLGPDGPGPFAPSGFMGQPDKITTEMVSQSGRRGMKFSVNATSGWAGVAFQHPDGDWGDLPGGYDLTGAKNLTFWVKGAKGGEKVKFEFGVLGRDKKHYDTSRGEMEVVLTPDWKRHSISLEGKSLRRIKTGFAWAAALDRAPLTFHLADVRYE